MGGDDDMWDKDRPVDPREMRDFMRHIAGEMERMRRDMYDVLREAREAQFVRRRLMRDMPGYWEDSIKLETVREKFREAM